MVFVALLGTAALTAVLYVAFGGQAAAAGILVGVLMLWAVSK